MLMAKIIGVEYSGGEKSAVYIESAEGRQKFVLERRGQWEWRGGIPWCSSCGEMLANYSYDGSATTTNYCAQCGAIMDDEM